MSPCAQHTHFLCWNHFVVQQGITKENEAYNIDAATWEILACQRNEALKEMLSPSHWGWSYNVYSHLLPQQIVVKDPSPPPRSVGTLDVLLKWGMGILGKTMWHLYVVVIWPEQSIAIWGGAVTLSTWANFNIISGFLLHCLWNLPMVSWCRRKVVLVHWWVGIPCWREGRGVY